MVVVPNRRKHFRGGLTTYTSKAVTVDITNNHGNSDAVGIRSFDFYLDDALVAVAFTDFTWGQTSAWASFWNAFRAFITAYSKTGSDFNTSWLSANGVNTNQRIWIRFDTPIVYNRVVVNNWHSSGLETDRGAKVVNMHSTEDLGIPASVFEVPMVDQILLFGGQLREHVPFDVEDGEELTLE